MESETNTKSSEKFEVQESTDSFGKLNLPTIDEYVTSYEDGKCDDAMSINPKITFLASLLLLGPFIMGENINALGNADPIKGTFAKQLGFSKVDTDPKALPNGIWAIGFLFPFGGLFGALLGAYYSNIIGRKHLTLIFVQTMIIGSGLKIIAKYAGNGVPPFFIGRYFDGLGSGGLMVSAVTWMFDLLAPRIHKYYKPCIQMLINFGIFFAAVTQINKITHKKWENYFWAPIIFSVIMTIAVILLPESPKYVYMTSRNKNYTEKVMKEVRGSGFRQKEFDEMIREVDSEANMKQMTILEFIKNRTFLPGTIAALYINLAQQITGINAIVAFSSTILGTVGISDPDESALIVLGLAVLGSLIFAPFVGLFYRKLMLVIGFAGMTISFCFNIIMINWKLPEFTQIIFLSLFVFIFQIGPGPLVWFISIEIFPPYAVSAAQGVTTFANWFGNTCVFLLFPIVQDAIGFSSLYIFIAINLFTIIFLQIFSVETLNRNTDSIIREYGERFRLLGK